MDNNIMEELKYLRGRVDTIYDILNQENGRISCIEERVKNHTYNHYKTTTFSIAIAAITVTIVDIILRIFKII